MHLGLYQTSLLKLILGEQAHQSCLTRIYNLSLFARMTMKGYINYITYIAT